MIDLLLSLWDWFYWGALADIEMVLRSLIGTDVTGSWELLVEGAVFTMPFMIYFLIMLKWVWDETDWSGFGWRS